MAIDELFIEIADFKEYKDISENMDFDRMNSYIRDAQVLDLRLFLGRELYLKMLSDWNFVGSVFTNPDYNDLFFGVEFQGIKYNGLKPVEILFTYARIVEDINISITRTGVRQFNADESEPVSDNRIATKAAAARSTALAYQNDMEKYLNLNSLKYPDWANTSLSKTGYPFFKV